MTILYIDLWREEYQNASSIVIRAQVMMTMTFRIYMKRTYSGSHTKRYYEWLLAFTEVFDVTDTLYEEL
jgi:hypothetical protein